MEICIFAETLEYDQKSYEIIVRRILKEKYNCDIPIFRKLEFTSFNGKDDLIKQLPIAISQILHKFTSISAFIILIDADGKYPTTTNQEKKKVKNRIENFSNTYSGLVIIGVPTRNIEAWLLGDNKNLMEVTGVKNIPCYPFVENIIDPKGEFNKIYHEYRRIMGILGKRSLAKPELVNSLFDNLNIKTLASRSKTFSIFVEEIRDLSR